MNLDFDLNATRLVEFGVGREGVGYSVFDAIPVDAEVQAALREMVEATRDAVPQDDGPLRYEPSEKHAAVEYLYLPLDDPMAAFVRELHLAVNLTIDAAALRNPSGIFCYFARLTDATGRKLTGLRRATQFKGVLKSRLLRFSDDSLKIIEDSVFKLDREFDLLVDAETVHIIHPSSFEFAGKLQQAILDAVPRNVGALARALNFVDFGPIGEYARTRPRAARYVASIMSHPAIDRWGRAELLALCARNSVTVEDVEGRIIVPPGNEMGFLEVLDRRRYDLELVPGEPERFRAASRQSLAG